MKRYCLSGWIILFSAGILHAASGSNSRISVDYNQTPLKAALKDFEEKSGVRFAYADKIMADVEAVTLKLKDTPARLVLQKLLRRRGLEAVTSGKGLLAIIPMTSEMGMAKATGRSIRTFVRLAMKLEKAKRTGDEVTIPGWVEQDDEDLALALADFIGSVVYYEEYTRTRGSAIVEKRLTAAESMLRSKDKDVRAGIVAPFVFHSLRGLAKGSPSHVRFKKVVRLAMADKAPMVRACWLLVCAEMNRQGDSVWAGKCLQDAAGSASPELRFAACIAIGGDSATARAMAGSFPRLVKDSSPAVRLTGIVAGLERMRSVPELAGEVSADSLRLKLVRDPNPIVRSLGLAYLTAEMSRRKAEKLQEILNGIKKEEDPWLELCLTLIKPALRGEGMSVFPKIVELVTSKKRSHQALAATSLFMGLTMVRSVTRGAQKKQPVVRAEDIVSLVGLAESPWLWARACGVLVSACTPMASVLTGSPVPPELTSKADKHYHAALESDKEPLRLMGLLASMARMRMGPPHAKVLTASRKALKSGAVAEQMLGGFILGFSVPIAEAVGEFRTASARDPNSLQAMTLLYGIESNRGLQRGKNKEAVDSIVKEVLATRNSLLEIRLVRSYQMVQDKTEILSRLISEGQTDTVLTMISDSMLSHSLSSDKLLPKVLERLMRGWETVGEQERGRFARAFSGMFLSNHAFKHAIQYPKQKPFHREFRTNVTSLSVKMLDTCLKKNSRDVSAGFMLLRAWYELFGAFTGEHGLPEVIQGRARQALSLVQDEKYAVAVAEFLALLRRVQRSRNAKPVDAAFLKAMDEAQTVILKSGSPEARFTIHCDLAMGGDKSSAEEVTSLLSQDKLPADRRLMAVRALAAQPKMASPTFIKYLYSHLRSRAASRVIRLEAYNALWQIETERGNLVDALQEISQTRPADPSFSHYLRQLQYNVQYIASSKRKNQLPLPSWLKKAGALGLAILKDTDQPMDQRHNGLALHVQAEGHNAGALVERVVQDSKEDANLRQKAASLLHVASPTTGLYKKLLLQYDTLPLGVRGKLAESAASSPGAEKAEAFLIKGLMDPVLRKQQRHSFMFGAVNRLSLPPSKALVKAVEDVRKDPDGAGFHWGHALTKLKRKQKEITPEPEEEPQPKEVEVF